MIPIVIVGAAGRMGRAVEEAARGADDLRVKARIDRSPGPGPERPGYPGDGGILDVEALGPSLATGDVVVEFGGAGGCLAAANACTASGAALVSGSTGLGKDEEAALGEAAQRVAVLRAANFSLGLVALRRAVSAALASLPASWDVEIVERHHRAKIDSPSGTALEIARQVSEVREGARSVFGREGRVGKRPVGEIGIHAVRGGTWIGDHSVLIAGEGESLELRHVAESRVAFAQGVLAAIRFVAGARPGLYTLEDVPPPKRLP